MNSQPKQNEKLDEMIRRFASALVSAHILFPAENGFTVPETAKNMERLFDSESGKSDRKSAVFTRDLIRFLELAWSNLAAGGEMPDLVRENLPYAQDPVVCLNRLTGECTGKSFSEMLERAMEENAYDLYLENLNRMNENADVFKQDFIFYLKHADSFRENLETLIPDYLNFLRSGKEYLLERLYPSAGQLRTSCDGKGLLSEKRTDEILEHFRRLWQEKQMFGSSRIYRHSSLGFSPLALKNIRDVHAFYGYQEVRRIMLEHYKAFSEGRSNLPLLISSLPGLGKTQMTISHVLYFNNLTLVLPDPGDIAEGLEALILKLEGFKDRRFVLFFDDIDAEKTNWYFFRTRIGGAFSLPENITVTVASNQAFPASVSSRGRGFTFPIFDEIRCMEMVGDSLQNMGMKHPSSNLVSVIAADYVEQFGQKVFEELSPRTLVRYLDELRKNPEKRSQMLKISQGELIPRPDSQVFYEENLKLMRRIYGDSILDDWRTRELQGGKKRV